MVSRNELWKKKTLVGLVLGQFLSLLITSTGFSSSELARRGINAPTSQSLLNYVLLALVYGSVLIYRKKALKLEVTGSSMRQKGGLMVDMSSKVTSRFLTSSNIWVLIFCLKFSQAKWYYYILLGLVDVEANFLVVKAYQYTSLTSVMLLDCWSIPCVILLTWLFLKTKYRFIKIVGVGICVAGLVMVVFSDVHAADRSSGTNPLKGDILVIVGSMLYAISNVSEEFLVKSADRVELMAMLGLFGAIISACQIGIIERNELKSIHWSAGAVLPFTGFAAAMFLFYSFVPILLKLVMTMTLFLINECVVDICGCTSLLWTVLYYYSPTSCLVLKLYFPMQMSGSTMLNLSLLTSDMWAVLIRIFAYHEKVDWMYFVAFAAVAVGLVVYSGGDKEADQNRAEVADEEAEQSKHFDEESGPGNPDNKTSAGTSKSGDKSKYDFASTSVGEMNDIG
ncbi:hypothetical protein RJ640_000757, partial [Escallonia rubra]